MDSNQINSRPAFIFNFISSLFDNLFIDFSITVEQLMDKVYEFVLAEKDYITYKLIYDNYINFIQNNQILFLRNKVMIFKDDICIILSTYEKEIKEIYERLEDEDYIKF